MGVWKGLYRRDEITVRRFLDVWVEVLPRVHGEPHCFFIVVCIGV
jgi:hypothetical protein